jgi:hypothetical protein
VVSTGVLEPLQAVVFADCSNVVVFVLELELAATLSRARTRSTPAAAGAPAATGRRR